MSIAELLKNLRESGIELRLENDRLICNAPKGTMTSDTMSALKNRKAEIIAFLEQVATSKWSSLVSIQPKGNRRPFFCFHGVGGNVLNYGNFISYLGLDQPLYGFQALGLDGETEPFKAIEPMADYYINEIKKIQPCGPYFLGGGSMGGMVAFEAAQKLQQYGDEIGFLAMFDTIGPNYKSAPNYGPSPLRKLIKRMIQNTIKENYVLIKEKIALRIEHKQKIQQCRKMLEEKIAIPHEMRFWYVEQMNRLAMNRYRCSSFNGEIVLFKGSNETEGVYSDPERGWRGIAKKGLRIIEIPGKHGTLVEESLLGFELAKYLGEAQLKIKP